MPTKRTRTRRQFQAPISDAILFMFETGQYPEHGQFDSCFDAILMRGDEALMRETWASVREEFLSNWLADHPGKRPWIWWELDAPRWSDGPYPPRCEQMVHYLKTIAEPRRRLGGVGTPSFELLNYWPEFSRGIPKSWRDLRRDDLPRYESQPSYLERHGLLTTAERARLTAKDFGPEAIAIDDDDEVIQ